MSFGPAQGQVASTVVTSGVTTSAIAANAVTNAKLAQMADQRIKGNISGATADPADLTAGQVQTMLGIATIAPLARTTVRKTADESVTSSAVLQNDDELLFAIGANEEWVFEAVLVMTAGYSGGQGGMRCAVTTPSGATQRLFASANGSNASTGVTFSGSTTSSGTVVIQGSFAGSQPPVIVIRGRVVNGATPGNVTIQWAQNASNVNATTMAAGSFMDCARVGNSLLGFTSPSAADFTALNSATINNVTTDMGAGVQVHGTHAASSAVSNWLGGYKAMNYSSGTITLDVGLLINQVSVNYNFAGIFFMEASSGKLTTFNITAQTGIIPKVNVSKWPSVTGGGAGDYYDISHMAGGRVVFMRLTYDGTNMRFYLSFDSTTWLLITTVAKANYFTTAPDQWGFAISQNNDGSYDGDISCFHWKVS